MRIEIQRRLAGEWHEYDFMEMAGKTLIEVLLELEGTETVMKTTNDDGAELYVCGTDALVGKYKVRELKAMHFREFLHKVSRRRPEILKTTCPPVDGTVLGDVLQAFPGAVLTGIPTAKEEQ